MARSVCVLVFVCGFAAIAAAQEGPDPSGVAAAEALLSADAAPAPQLVRQAGLSRARDQRPAALVPLYVSFATLQAMDYVSTTRALASGAGTESNPLMKPIVGNRAVFLAVKAGATLGTIAAGERLRKRHPRRAVILMVVANAAMASIVTRNFAISSSF